MMNPNQMNKGHKTSGWSVLNCVLRKADARDRKRIPKPLAKINFVKAGTSRDGTLNELGEHVHGNFHRQ